MDAVLKVLVSLLIAVLVAGGLMGLVSHFLPDGLEPRSYQVGFAILIGVGFLVALQCSF